MSATETVAEWLSRQRACEKSAPLWRGLADLPVADVLPLVRTPLGLCLLAIADGHGPRVGAVAWLTGGSLWGANLAFGQLRGVDLRGAYLRGTNLTGASLDGANLTGADLTGARLDGAYLGGANLTGARLRGADLDGVIQ